MKAVSDLRSIVQSGVVYSTDHEDRFPPSLGTLVRENYMSAELLLHPRSNVRVPEDFNQWDAQKQSKWIDENGSYVFIADGDESEFDSKKIVIYAKPKYAGRDGIAVGFADAHAETLPVEEVDRRLKQQTGKGLPGLAKPAQSADDK